MSATQPRENKISPKGIKLPAHQINPSYTVRVICCVFFIFLTEIFLAHYVYRLIISDIRDNYLSKTDFRQNFQNEIRTEAFREEVIRVLTYLEMRKEPKSPKAGSSTTQDSHREKRSVGKTRDYNFLADSKIEEPAVEFFHTKIPLRDENEDDTRRRMNVKGGAPGDDQWIWVTSSSRIQVKQRLQTFRDLNKCITLTVVIATTYLFITLFNVKSSGDWFQFKTLRK